MNEPIERNIGSRLTGALKTAVVTGLAGLVLVSAAGCETAASTLAKFEYGAKTTRSKDTSIQGQVIQSDAKYEDTISTVPGFGIRYKSQ
jgi:hypothetical protein